MLFRPLEAPRKRRRPGNKVVKSESTKPLLARTPDERTNEINALKERRVEQLNAGGDGVTKSLHDVSTAEKTFESERQRHNSDAGHAYKRRGHRAHASHKHGDAHAHHHHKPHVASRKDQFYTASLENIPQYNQDREHYTASMTRLNTDDSSPALTDDGHVDDNPWPCCSCLSLERRRALKKTFDFSLFKDLYFELFAWSNFLTNFTFFIPFLFLPDRAVTLGESERKGALLVSVIGIFNTAGKLQCTDNCFYVLHSCRYIRITGQVILHGGARLTASTKYVHIFSFRAQKFRLFCKRTAYDDIIFML